MDKTTKKLLCSLLCGEEQWPRAEIAECARGRTWRHSLLQNLNLESFVVVAFFAQFFWLVGIWAGPPQNNFQCHPYLWTDQKKCWKIEGNYHHNHSVIGSFNFRCYWNWPRVLPITASNFCWVQVTKLIWMVARSYSWEEAPRSNLICVISYADGSAISVRLLTHSQSDAKTKAKSVLIRRMQDVKHLSEPVLISSLHRPVPWDQHSTWPRN